jgi:hypothetical protein
MASSTNRDREAYSWHSFLWLADQWLVAYSMLTGELSSPLLFSVGHALELYLKASYTNITGRTLEATKFGHRISDLWKECKRLDPRFLTSYELRDNILHQDLFQVNPRDTLSSQDFKHYLSNQELYIVAKLLPDLKYMGTQLKALDGAYSLGFMSCNPYWMRLYREIRRFLNYPPPEMMDLIKLYIDDHQIRQESQEFLLGLYFQSSK